MQRQVLGMQHNLEMDVFQIGMSHIQQLVRPANGNKSSTREHRGTIERELGLCWLHSKDGDQHCVFVLDENPTFGRATTSKIRYGHSNIVVQNLAALAFHFLRNELLLDDVCNLDWNRDHSRSQA